MRIEFSMALASSIASWTKALIEASPNELSMYRPKPPTKPLPPAKPTPPISYACPSSTLTPASHSMSRTTSGWPHSCS